MAVVLQIEWQGSDPPRRLDDFACRVRREWSFPKRTWFRRPRPPVYRDLATYDLRDLSSPTIHLIEDLRVVARRERGGAAGERAGGEQRKGADFHDFLRGQGLRLGRARGPIRVVDHLGQEFALPTGKDAVALCRCGGSQKKPFCDGSHRHNGFAACDLALPKQS